MNDRKIGKAIEAKMQLLRDDHDTLTDVLHERYIVAGGAILSLIRDEEPNDYDIFLRKEIRWSVIQYFISLLDTFGEDTSILDRLIKPDTDAGLPDEQALEVDEDIQNEMSKEYSIYPVYITENAITLSQGYQIILKYSFDRGDEWSIIKEFDWQHSKAYYSPIDETVYADGKTLWAILNNELVYTGSEYPLASLFRMEKFLRRGMTISYSSILALGLDIAKLNITPSNIQSHLLGVDLALIDTLGDGDPMSFKILDEAADRIRSPHVNDDYPLGE